MKLDTPPATHAVHEELRAIRDEALHELRLAGYAEAIIDALSKPRPNVALAPLPRDLRSAAALTLISIYSQFDEAWSRTDWRKAASHAFRLGRVVQLLAPKEIPAALRESHRAGALKSAAARRKTRAAEFDPLIRTIWASLPPAARNADGLSYELKKAGKPRSPRACRDDIRRLGLK
jgi:hypothetical protein